MIDFRQRNDVKCKGLFFKARINEYIGKKKEFNYKIILTPIKSSSCTGCDYCHSIWEFYDDSCFSELLNINEVDPNCIYTLSWFGESTDPDDAIVKFEKVIQNDKV